MERKFQEELDELKRMLLSMGAKVEKNIGDANEALINRDGVLARDVVERDAEIDLEEIRIDELCLSLIALRQPVARDLRFITTALKIVKDMERIGDMAGDISHRALQVLKEPPLVVLKDLRKLTRAAQKMLNDALDSFVHQDVVQARRVIQDDDQVDQYHRNLFKELIEVMVKDPRTVPQATHLISVIKYLERIGDHSTNIAEMVVFLVEGRDIRHLHKLQRFHGAEAPPPSSGESS